MFLGLRVAGGGLLGGLGREVRLVALDDLGLDLREAGRRRGPRLGLPARAPSPASERPVRIRRARSSSEVNASTGPFGSRAVSIEASVTVVDLRLAISNPAPEKSFMWATGSTCRPSPLESSGGGGGVKFFLAIQRLENTALLGALSWAGRRSPT